MDQLNKKTNSSFENRPIPLFDPMLHLENLNESWHEWTKKFETFAENTELFEKGDKIMIAALLFYAGPEVSRLYDALNKNGEHEYDDVKNALSEYFDINEKNLDQPNNVLEDRIETTSETKIIKVSEGQQASDMVQKENSTVTSSQTNNEVRVSSNRVSDKYSRKSAIESKEVKKKISNKNMLISSKITIYIYLFFLIC